MHTTVEMVDMDDVAHTIRLLLACITQMDATTDVDYFS
jgi:putative aminopeptidase FrvX